MLEASYLQAHPLNEKKNTTPLPKRVRKIILKTQCSYAKISDVNSPKLFSKNQHKNKPRQQL